MDFVPRTGDNNKERDGLLGQYNHKARDPYKPLITA